MNPFADTNWNPDFSERKKFARSLAFGFPTLGLFMEIAGYLKHGGWSSAPIAMGVGGSLLGLALWAAPQVALPVYRAWYFVTCCIGIVVSNLFVACVFYLVITPAAVIMRFTGRDQLGIRSRNQAKSYWSPAEKGIDPARYFRQY